MATRRLDCADATTSAEEEIRAVREALLANRFGFLSETACLIAIGGIVFSQEEITRMASE